MKHHIPDVPMFLFVAILCFLCPPSDALSGAKTRPAKTPWVACVSAIEVTRAISKFVLPKDSVLEMGANCGDVSAAICSMVGPGGRAVLMDVERKEASSGRSGGRDTSMFLGEGEFSDRATFVEMSSLENWRHALWNRGEGAPGHAAVPQRFDVLVVDLGSMTGNDLGLKALSIVHEFLAHHSGNIRDGPPPRAVIIKSTSVANLSRRLYHPQRMFDGTSRLPTPDELGRSHEPVVVAAVGVEEYRRMIPLTVRRGDHAVEVGCHFGTSTIMLHRAASSGGDASAAGGFCIGIDNGRRIVNIAKKQYSDVPFAVGDAWRTAQLIRIKDQLVPHSAAEKLLGFDVVYIDVGGLSGPDGLLESLALIDSIGCACEPRCVVIKSTCMRNLAGRLRPFSKIWNAEKKKVIES